MFILEISTDFPQLVKDELYGLMWHRINEGMKNETNPAQMLYKVDILRAIDKCSDILNDFEQYRKGFKETDDHK